MSDIADQAEQTEQLFRDAAIKAARKPLDTRNPSGECLYCSEPTGTDRRWCNSDCASWWSRENE